MEWGMIESCYGLGDSLLNSSRDPRVCVGMIDVGSAIGTVVNNGTSGWGFICRDTQILNQIYLFT